MLLAVPLLPLVCCHSKHKPRSKQQSRSLGRKQRYCKAERTASSRGQDILTTPMACVQTADILKHSCLPFVVMINPLALPDPGDDPVEVCYQLLTTNVTS